MKKAKTIQPNRRQRGFTMIELVITVTMVAILAAIAVPSMQIYARNNRITGSTQELLRSLQTARTEATKLQTNVVVCMSASPLASNPTCSTATPAGWIVFVDTDNNWDHGSTEQLLETHTFDSTKLTIRSDQNGRFSYNGTGFRNTVGGTATQSFVICDSRGNVNSSGGNGATTNSVARGLTISNTGRATMIKTVGDISTRLGATYINSTCP